MDSAYVKNKTLLLIRHRTFEENPLLFMRTSADRDARPKNAAGSLAQENAPYIHMCVYIYIERERYVYIYIYIYMYIPLSRSAGGARRVAFFEASAAREYLRGQRMAHKIWL